MAKKAAAVQELHEDHDPFRRKTGYFITVPKKQLVMPAPPEAEPVPLTKRKVRSLENRLPSRPVIAPERGMTSEKVARRQKDLVELIEQAQDACDALFGDGGGIRPDLLQLMQYWICRAYDIGSDIKKDY